MPRGREAAEEGSSVGMQRYRVRDSFRCATVCLVLAARRSGRNWVVFWWGVCMLKNEILVLGCTLFTNLD